MTLGMKLGTKLNADLVVATDPDADRLAIVCRDDKGEWSNVPTKISMDEILSVDMQQGKEFVPDKPQKGGKKNG